MAKRHRSGLLRQARLESQVRFQPEKQALSELLFQARQDLASGLAAEHGAAEGIKAAVHAAGPELTKHYAQASGRLDEAHAQLHGDLATLSASADPYKAVASKEAAAARARLNEAFVGAQKQLQDRKVGAEAARAYGVQSQLGQYEQKVGQYGRTAIGLAQREGTFTQATIGDLRKAQQDAAYKDRSLRQQADLGNRRIDATLHGQALSHQDRQAAARRKAAGGKSKFRAGALAKHQKIVGDIQDAASIAARLKKAGSSSNAIVELMTLPRSKDNPYGGYGAFTTRSAVSLAFNGYIKPHLLKGLRARGLLLHRTPGAWKNPPRRPHGGVLHGAFPGVYGR